MTSSTDQVVATADRRGNATASTLSLGASRTVLELKAFFRERDALIFSFLFPIIMLGIFSVVFGGEESSIGGDGGPTIDFTQYFLPGMIAAGIFLVSFQTLAITIAVERDDGTLKRLRGTPMPPVSYFLGKIGMVLITAVAQTAILLAYAVLVFQVPLPTAASSWFTFGWVFVLGTAAGTVLGIAFSSVPKSARSAPAVVTTPLLILQFISGVFFIFNDLPTWLQYIASIFPLKWTAQGMRSVFLPPEFEAAEVSGSWQHGLTAIILTVWLIVGLIVCIRTFRWQRRDAG
jgi:ABC-2 type transport system permease protein